MTSGSRILDRADLPKRVIGTILRFILQPWQLLLLFLAGWVNREQQEIIEYLRSENQILRESHGKKRIRLNDNQRRRLAIKAKGLGLKLLGEIASIVTTDTILRWHRQLVAEKWDYSHSRARAGRPSTAPVIVDLVLRMARENPTWAYDRIAGALANLGFTISDTTVGNVLQEHGIEPTPDRMRKSTWKTFIRSHWDVLGAIDFTTIEVWTRRGLITFYLLFAMEVATRRVHFVGCTTNPHEAWMRQDARNLTHSDDGFLLGTRYLLMDRDTNSCSAFRSVLEDSGVKPVRLPPQSPILNAHLERFIRSLKSECLNHMIFFGERSVRRAVREFLERYHRERNHQGLGNRLITADKRVGRTEWQRPVPRAPGRLAAVLLPRSCLNLRPSFAQTIEKHKSIGEVRLRGSHRLFRPAHHTSFRSRNAYPGLLKASSWFILAVD